MFIVLLLSNHQETTILRAHFCGISTLLWNSVEFSTGRRLSSFPD